MAMSLRCPEQNAESRNGDRNTGIPRSRRHHRGAVKIVSSRLVAGIGSRRSTPRGGKILENSGGIDSEERLGSSHNGASRALDGWSEALAFAFAYAKGRTIGRRASNLRYTPAKIAPDCGEDDPFIGAAIAAMLSIHSAQAREFPSAWIIKGKAGEIAAAIPDI